MPFSDFPKASFSTSDNCRSKSGAPVQLRNTQEIVLVATNLSIVSVHCGSVHDSRRVRALACDVHAWMRVLTRNETKNKLSMEWYLLFFELKTNIIR